MPRPYAGLIAEDIRKYGSCTTKEDQFREEIEADLKDAIENIPAKLFTEIHLVIEEKLQQKSRTKVGLWHY